MKFLEVFPIFLLFWALPIHAQQLDQTFGTGGINITGYNNCCSSPFSYSESYGSAGFLSPDGGIRIFGLQNITYVKSPVLPECA